jgi:hypothetical protein
MAHIIHKYSVAILATVISGCVGESAEISLAKHTIRNALIDGETAQFSDLKFFKRTNFVCGQVNAKNRIGGYVGKKTFIVSLGDKAYFFQPDTDIPNAPTASIGVTLEETAKFIEESTSWRAKVAEIKGKGEAYEQLLQAKCRDEPKLAPTPAEDAKKEVVNNEMDFIYSLGTPQLPPNYAGDNLDFIVEKVKALARPKDTAETTSDYNKRMSVLLLDPTPANFDRLYAIRLNDEPYTISKFINYDADKEILEITYTDKFLTGLCNPGISNSKTFPLTLCDYGGKGVLSISSKNTLFAKYSVRTSDAKLELKDKFKLPRGKISTLLENTSSSKPLISSILVGKIVKDQKFPTSWGAIPFDPKFMVHYSKQSGEVLEVRQLQ